MVPARRSRWSRGASRTSSAPAAGSARHRADAARGAARSPDAQPASCRRSFPCDFRARTAPSTRHRWRPRPDRQSLPGCVGREVLAGACVPNSWPRRCSSRSSSLSLICRASLEERKALASAKTAPAAAPGRSMRGTPVRGSCTSTVRPWNPVATAIAGPPSQDTVPERLANVQKGARLRGTGACRRRDRVGRRPEKRRMGRSPDAVTPQNAVKIGVSSDINPYE